MHWLPVAYFQIYPPEEYRLKLERKVSIAGFLLEYLTQIFCNKNQIRFTNLGYLSGLRGYQVFLRWQYYFI